MRYIILNRNVTKKELYSRKKFIEKVTGMYFIPYSMQYGIQYVSIPSNSFNYLIIVGHNGDVSKFLSEYEIDEELIAVVSCKFSIPKKIKNKKIYVSYNNNGITDYYDGSQWMLDFKITDSELSLINSYGNILEKIDKSFKEVR